MQAVITLDANETKAQARLSKHGFHLQKRRAVSNASRWLLSAQYVVIARRFAVRSYAEEGVPQQWIKPMQDQQDAKNGVEQQVPTPNMNEFVPQDKVGFFVGQRFKKVRVEK
jgi:hypothetical protein